MPKKPLNYLLLPLVLGHLIGACSKGSHLDEPLLEQQIQASLPQPPDSPLPKEYRQPYAELIQPRTNEVFTHLAGYEGHALIGNTRIQAVVAGVDPQAGRKQWSPLFLAFYYNTADGWRKLTSVFDTSFSRNHHGKPIATQIEALVPARHGRHNAAHIDVVYSLENSRNKREFLRIYLDDSADEIMLTVDTKLITAHPSREEGRISLRVKQTRGELLRLHHGVAHYSTDDVLTIAGSPKMAQTVAVEGRQITLQSKGLNAVGWEGFVLGIGPQAGAAVHVNATTRERCFANASVVKQTKDAASFPEFFAAIRDCQTKEPQGEVVIKLSPEEEPWQSAYRRFLLWDGEGRKVGYTYGIPGQALRIPLVADEEYKIQELSTGEEWGSRSPIKVDNGSSETLSLSARRPGRVEIAAGKASSAALMTIRSGIAPKAVNFTNDIVMDSEGTRMSESVVLVRAWPVKMELPPGQYSFEFFRQGTAHSICQFDTVVTEEETKKLDCKTKAGTAAGKHTTIDTDTPTDGASIASLKEALAVSQLTISATSVDAGDDADHVKKLDIFDPNSLLSLSAFPVTDTFTNQWQSHVPDDRQSNLVYFAAYARRHAPEAIIQLNCPSNNLSAQELRTWIEQIQPDAVQWHGCQTRSDTKQAFDDLFRQPNPPLITPVSGLRNGGNSPFYPRITVNAKAARKSPIAQSIRNGKFSISAGAVLEVKDVSSAPLSSQSYRVKAKLRMSASDYALPLTLAVYAGTELIFEKNLPPVINGFIDETIDFDTTSESVRFEVNGSLRERGNNDSLPERFTLASTNFIQVGHAQSGRNHQKETQR